LIKTVHAVHVRLVHVRTCTVHVRFAVRLGFYRNFIKTYSHMKQCKYENCKKPHNRKSAYCCDSHRVRQWELKNNKKPFFEQPKAAVSKAAIGYDHLFRPSVGGGHIKTIPAKTETHIIPNQTNFARNTSIIFSLMGGFFGKKKRGEKFSLDGFLKGGTTGFFLGATMDWLAPNSTQETVMIEPSREVYIPAEDKNRMSSARYQDAKIKRLGLTGKYKKLFGDPAKDFYMIVDGSPGHGKSWWVAEFAQHFHRFHGKVIYYAAEQSGLNLAFQEMLTELNTSFEIETNPKRLSKQKIKEDFNNYDLVILDSVSYMGMTPQELRDLREETNCAIVAVLQSTKEGQHKGSNEWLHDVGISVNLVRYEPQVRKTRYKKIEPPKSGGRVINL